HGLTTTPAPLVDPATTTAVDALALHALFRSTAASYTDAVGNTGGTGSDSVTIDTLNPTVAVDIADTSLSDGDNSSVVTFTFSEAPEAFTAAVLTPPHVVVSRLIATPDPLVYT